MKYSLLDSLQCPESFSPLNLFVVKEGKSLADNSPEVELGLLQSKTNPNIIYPITNGIPRMLPDSIYDYLDVIIKNAEKLPIEIKGIIYRLSKESKKILDSDFKHTQKSFSSEWDEVKDSDRAWGRSPEVRREDFYKNLDLRNESLDGNKVLDVGCGHGEIELALINEDVLIFAIELSSSIDNLKNILNRLNNRVKADINIIQANLYKLPLVDDFFDIVFCDGVLHHTPSTFVGLKSITRKLRNGGRCFVMVYSFDHKNLIDKIRLHLTNLARKLTIHLPHRLLHWICYMLAPFHFVYVNSYNLIMGYNRYSKRTLKETELSLFDGFSPKYAWHHSTQELIQMFTDLGYEKLKKTFSNHNGIGIVGILKK